MPTYTYECPRCEHQRTEILTLAQHETFSPRHCRKQMFQVMFAPQITTDIAPYRSMITGERIAGRKQHRDHLRAHGCIEVGNETPKPRAAPKAKSTRKEMLHKLLADKSDKQVQAMVKQTIKEKHV